MAGSFSYHRFTTSTAMPSRIIQTETTFILPDLLANWPFQAEPNPQQDIVAESAVWVESFAALEPKVQEAYNRCRLGLLASFAYPHAQGPHFRSACDLMNLSFVFDERVDRDSGRGVRHQTQEMMNALRHPYQNAGANEGVVGVMTRDFWLRSLSSAGTNHEAAQRFVRDTQVYTDAVCQRSLDRDAGYVRSIDEYMAVRRGTIGFRPSLFYILLEDDLPDEIVEHPVIKKLIDLATDMMIIANDICSYNVEQARGDDMTNLVRIAMREKNLDLQASMDFIGSMNTQLAADFIASYAELPSFSPEIDQRVKDFCWGVGNWVTASVKWNFATERYFGKEGPQIQRHRCVRLAPKRADARRHSISRAQTSM
ncbi:hypothetical protein HGRIS_014814 [Hohenbuehelia grisea]|uniref:Terpene synthase n=1 Tax=Hohenbuehelia grisea TaxID=104357 RepID=A0ABR3IQT9_9AGAR